MTAASFIVAVALGLLLALLRRSRNGILRFVGDAYVEVFRNIPILTQLFIIYFGLSRLGIQLPAMFAVVLGFGLNGTALLSEIFRASINAVDQGQSDAAMAIGMTRRRSMVYIILPQAMRSALPPIGNFAIALLKDTSLASAAAVPELAFRARMLVSETYRTDQVYVMVAVIYLLLSLLVSSLTRLIERRVNRGGSEARMSLTELFSLTWIELISAAWSTLELAISALTLGLSFGLLLALIRLGRTTALTKAIGVYIEVVRGTPALIQLFIIYFGLVSVGIRFSSFQAAVVGLGLNAAAYLAEVYRAGIEAVPLGQYDASLAIGMARWEAMRWIILPQALRVVLGPIGNVAISLLKDTSVASLIAAPDLMLRAQDVSSEYFMPLETYIIVGCMYFALCFPLSVLIRGLERNLVRR